MTTAADQPDLARLEGQPIDFRPEFRRAGRAGFLVGCLLWIVGVLVAIPVRAWGSEAMTVVAVSLALAWAVGILVFWLLLNRRAFAAMRAVGVLNELPAADTDAGITQARQIMKEARDAASRGEDPVPHFARAVVPLDPRARRGPLDVESGIRRITLVLAVVGLGPLAAALALAFAGGAH